MVLLTVGGSSLTVPAVRAAPDMRRFVEETESRESLPQTVNPTPLTPPLNRCVLPARAQPLQFHSHIGIDYSGAATPETRTASIQVCRIRHGTAAEFVASPRSTTARKRNWNRIELFSWLDETLSERKPVIVGIDHGFSFPDAYWQRYRLTSWDQFLDDFARHWPADQPGTTIQQLRSQSKRVGDSRQKRLTERWTPSAKSVFQFNVQGSVATSTHAGLPFLQKLRQSHPKVHFWPFDGWNVPANVSVVAEVYPSLFRNRYPRETRRIDEQDAFSVASWLSEMDSRGQLPVFLQPPLSTDQRQIALREGWILGVY